MDGLLVPPMPNTFSLYTRSVIISCTVLFNTEITKVGEHCLVGYLSFKTGIDNRKAELS